ncbi:MAG: HEAT repeat domain-containing protein [Dongiaceae bacterium]
MDSEFTRAISFDDWKSSLRSEDPTVRSDAADFVPEGVEPALVIRELKVALEDADDLVRTCAADTLGFLVHEDARVALRDRLAVETDVLTRAFILSSLGEIGTTEDLKLIVGYLKSDVPNMVRCHAAYGLMELALDQGLAIQAYLADGEDQHVRSKAFSHMDNIIDSMLYALEVIRMMAEKHREADETGVAKSHIESIVLKLSTILKSE